MIGNKIIFLDIDGVLNIMPHGRDNFGSLFHPHLIENLKEVIEDTGAKIVISSSWRINGLAQMQEMWKFRSLPGEVIDVTVDVWQTTKHYNLEFLDACERGHEIQEWLDRHEIESYVIIDDDLDILKSQLNNFVRTSNNKNHTDHVNGYGLTKECSQYAIQILNKKF